MRTNPSWRHVQEEPAEELDRVQGHRPSLSAARVVLPEELDLVTLQADQPPIADRRPVGVARQVFEHLFGPAERRLGVDDPLGLGRRRETALERGRVRQGGEVAVEGELSPVEGGAEQREELAPEHPAEDADREEETRATGDPTRAVGRQPAAGHDAMHVGVMLEVLTPGVEHGEEPDLGAEVLGVGSDPLQGLGGGLEQEAVDDARVLQGDRAERRR
jgi:hypothetical protein